LRVDGLAGAIRSGKHDNIWLSQPFMPTRPSLIQIETGDRQLLSHIADAMAESARRSGEWLVCRPGCTQCCLGPFEITPLDVRRLRAGLAALNSLDPHRAQRVQARAAVYDESIEDIPCPALDPETGWCDLYEWRPITCRTFGPVTRTADGALAACELCYTGASDEQMAACEVIFDPQGIEGGLLDALDAAGETDMTSVAGALQTAAEKGPLNG
jgi:Fe-S-cluster containining protein